jgi:hypothetical protein
VRNSTGPTRLRAIALISLIVLFAPFPFAPFAAIGCANGVLGDFGPIGGDDAGVASAPDAAKASVDAGASPLPSDDGGNAADPGVDASVDPPSSDDAGSDAGTLPKGGGGSDSGAVPGDAGPSVLLGKWTFDEGTGTSSADLSGAGHAAVLMGGASWSDAGKEGAGLALDGTTGYADVGVTLVDTSKSFSVLCWAKLNVANTWEAIASQDDVNGSLFGLKLRGDDFDFDFDVETSDVIGPGFVVAQSTTVGVAQTWFHVAGVYDASGGGALKIYVNGALQASAAIGQSVLASTGHFVIGRGLYNSATGSFFNGTLDEIEVHSGALTDSQVGAIFAAQQ